MSKRTRDVARRRRRALKRISSCHSRMREWQILAGRTSVEDHRLVRLAYAVAECRLARVWYSVAASPTAEKRSAGNGEVWRDSRAQRQFFFSDALARLDAGGAVWLPDL